MSDQENDNTQPPNFAQRSDNSHPGGARTRSSFGERVTGLIERARGGISRTASGFSYRGSGTGTGTRRGFEVLSLAEWMSKSVQTRGYAFYGNLITLLICTYFLADLTALLAGKYIPEPPLARPIRSASLSTRPKSVEDYNAIFTRNLFNSQGLIPGEEGNGSNDPGGAPVKTTLPFDLIGTVILKDETRSVATISDKSASQVYPVRVDDEIPGKAKILKIEPRRVIFVNLSANRREYVELPEDLYSTGARITLGSGGGGGGGIEQVSPNQFNINRGEVDSALSNLNNILTQARAVPNFENGVASGYKLFQIVPGSIYDKLGLKNGDVIAGLNGDPISDPGKAFEMLNQLKNSNHLELQVKRDGRTSTYTYDIH